MNTLLITHKKGHNALKTLGWVWKIFHKVDSPTTKQDIILYVMSSITLYIHYNVLSRNFMTLFYLLELYLPGLSIKMLSVFIADDVPYWNIDWLFLIEGAVYCLEIWTAISFSFIIEGAVPCHFSQRLIYRDSSLNY